ncbi:multifunctional methyltransferase subunit TRM112-like protein isoform X5 [Equus caballus]|uniref:multifunctional methyltransferase subunit TRM112-like protein isoform X5 n=2 Tax=Equus caballus TaxID=9796 RepID=UPI0038B410C6
MGTENGPWGNGDGSRSQRRFGSAQSTRPAPQSPPAAMPPAPGPDPTRPFKYLAFAEREKFQQLRRFRFARPSNRLWRGAAPEVTQTESRPPSGSGLARALWGNMKLLTHNLLSSHVRGVGPRGFPLRLQATEVRVSPVEFNPDFVARMIPKVEWAALLEAADTVRSLPSPCIWPRCPESQFRAMSVMRSF